MSTDPLDRLVDAIVERILARLAERLEQQSAPTVTRHDLYG